MFPHKHFCLQFKMITEMTPLKQKPRQIRPHTSNNLLNFSTDMAHSISAVFSNLNILQIQRHWTTKFPISFYNWSTTKRHDEYIYWLSYLCWNFFFSLSWCITDWSYQTNSFMLSNYFQKMPYNKTHILSFLLQYMPLFCHSFKTIFWSLFILCVSNPPLCFIPLWLLSYSSDQSSTPFFLSPSLSLSVH